MHPEFKYILTGEEEREKDQLIVTLEGEKQ